MADDSNLPAMIDPNLPLMELPVASIWDKSAFEQTERVAMIIADSGLMPMVLTHVREGQGNSAQDVMLPEKVIFARAVLIANQARHLDVDPVLFAQSCAIVKGRLMYEGKLVDAMIEKRLRVKLDYEFGLWNTDHFTAVDSEDKLHGAGDRLAVRVTAIDRDGRPVLGKNGWPKSVEGSVGLWKTSQWAAGASRQRLRYRGAREWARAHASGIMVGIVATDEADEIETATEAGRAIEQGKSTPQLISGDFGDGAAPRRRRGKAQASEPERQADAETSTAAGNVNTGAEETDGMGHRLDGGPPDLLEGDDLPDSVKGEVTTEPQADVQADGEKTVNNVDDDTGHAEPGEVYLLKGDGFSPDGRRLTYKDGVRFSSVTKASADQHAEYAVHAPEQAEPEEGNGEETGGAPSAETGQDSPDSATDASGSSAKGISSQEPTAEPSSDGGADDECPPELSAYIDTVEGTKVFNDAKVTMQSFYKTEYFQGLPTAQQNHIRAVTWDTLVKNKVDGLPNPLGDASAFRLWIEWQEDPEKIQGGLATLENNTEYKTKSDALKEQIRGAVKARLEAIQQA